MDFKNFGKKYGSKVNRGVIRFSRNVIVKAIMGGMARLLPITIVGSISILLASIPYAPYTAFIDSIGLSKYLTLTTTLTNDLISVYLAAVLSYEMARHYKKSVINSILIGVLSFFMVTPLTDAMVGEKSVRVLSLTYLGSKGMFVSIIVSLLAVRLYVLFIDRGPRIRMHKSVPPAIASSFESLIPIIGVSLFFVLVSVVFANTPYGDVHTLIFQVLQKPLQGASSNLSTLLIIAFVGEVFWWFGINSSVTSAIYNPLYGPLAIANASALALGQPLPFILNIYFYSIFKGPRHFVLSQMLFWLPKSKQLRAVGKVSVVPGFFGISEPLKFGIPMVYNPLTFLPMALSPVVSLAIAYFATVIGFLPRVGVDIPWSMPAIISGFLACGFAGIVVQIIQMIACFLIWFPFFKVLDRIKVQEEVEQERLEQEELTNGKKGRAKIETVST